MKSLPSVNFHTSIEGRVRVSIVDAKTGKTVRELPWQKNLILDQGLDFLANDLAKSMMKYCVVGTGNTPTKDLPDGFYSQSGTTVTRESGTRDFISGDVGKLIRFENGTERKITAFTDATHVTVGTSGTIPTGVSSKAISAAASTSTTMTITATAHGLSVGDRITIAGVTPSGYNGNWTVATVPDVNTITITDASNPGPGTVFGTLIIAALPILIYRVNQTGLTTETERSASYPTFNWEDGIASQTTRWDNAAQATILRRTYDFTERASNINYTEIGLSSVATVASNLFSRILLSGAVTVLIGQLLRVKYELVLKTTNISSEALTPSTAVILGWPRPYNIASITSNGTAWTLTLSESHHFVAGGKINIDGALRPKIAVTSAASTLTDFTITAAGHGRSPGDSIVIEGMTPTDYNGTFTIASVVGDDITVTSALNPGTGSGFGTVRQATPGTWYNGEHTIASVTSTTVVITSALTIPAAGASGTAYNNLKHVMKMLTHGWRQLDSANSTPANANAIHGGNPGDFPGCGALEGGLSTVLTTGFIADRGIVVRMEPVTVTVPPTVWPALWSGTGASGFNGSSNQTGLSNLTSAPSIVNSGSVAYASESAYVNGRFYRDTTVVWGAGAGNRNDIRMLTFWVYSAWNNVGVFNSIPQYPFAYLLFEERQRKDSTHKLQLSVRRSWNRELTIEAS